MQDAIPPIEQTPIVSLIPEVRVYTGQNQVRRNVGMFTGNFQGVETRVVNMVMAPEEVVSINQVTTGLVLSASNPVQLQAGIEIESNIETSYLTCTLLAWDVRAEQLSVRNLSATEQTELSLIYLVPPPPEDP